MKKTVIILLLILLCSCKAKESIVKEPPVDNMPSITEEVIISDSNDEKKEEDANEKIEIIINPDIIEEPVIDNQTAEEPASKSPGFKIIYTSDMHGFLNGKISYANLKAYKKMMIAEGYKTLLIDNGDTIHGTKTAKYNNGSAIINIMNKTGYDYLAIGNHDYAYGYDRLMELKNECEFQILSVNIVEPEENKPIFVPYDIIESDGRRIAIIGISYTSLGDYRSKYKKDGKYQLEILNNDKLFEAIQTIIDEVKDEVDCIVAMGHCSGTENDTDTKAYQIIKHTSGIDVFLSGHSHRIVENRIIRDKDGNEVIFSIPGGDGECFGVLTIADNCITTEIIREFEEKDEEILDLQNSLIEAVKQ